MPSSERLVLAPLVPEDADLLFAWINAREDVLLSAPYRPVHPAAHRAWFEAVQRRDDLVIFAIRDIADGRLIGTCQLHSLHPVHGSAELQIRIGAPEARGRGLGREAVACLVRFAFRDLNLHRVYLHVLATNERAIRAYEAVGFQREGVLREHAHIDGRRVDVVVMGVLRSEVADA